MANNNNNKILNVPNLRFPEFTGEWKKCKLGDVANLTKGVGISKGQKSSKGNPCILYGELYTTYKSEMITDIVSKTNIDSANLAKSKYNDVIIPSSGETAIDISTARCVQYNDVLLGGDLNIIRLNDGNDGSFFSYQLNGVRKRDIAKVAQGVSVVHLYGETLKTIKVNSPELAEQNKISSLLCLIDQRISTQNKIIDKLESLIKGLCEQLLNTNRGNMVTISEILSERSEKTTYNNQHEVLSSTVKGIYSQRDYFSKDIASENNVGYKIIHLNDIVLSPQNLWMGNINYNDKFEKGIVSPSYKVYAISNSFDNIYIAYLLKTHRALYTYMFASEQGASIVRRNLNIELFSQLNFRIPSLHEQIKIGNMILSIKRKLENELLQLNNLRLQKDYLLQQMFI